jgi:hypothetical protein
MLKVVATTMNEVEASLVMGRLKEAGIPCMLTGGGRRTLARGSVMVEEADLDRARATLKADEGNFDEAELARLSEEAGEKAAARELSRPQPLRDSRTSGDATPETPTEAAKHHRILGAFEKLAGREHGEDRKENPFGH